MGVKVQEFREVLGTSCQGGGGYVQNLNFSMKSLTYGLVPLPSYPPTAYP